MFAVFRGALCDSPIVFRSSDWLVSGNDGVLLILGPSEAIAEE